MILAKFWRYIFNLRLRKRVIAQDPSLGRVLFTNALLILIEPLGKILKNDEGKLYFGVRKLAKWEAFIYFSGALSTFSVQNQHDDKTSENRTRF